MRKDDQFFLRSIKWGVFGLLLILTIDSLAELPKKNLYFQHLKTDKGLAGNKSYGLFKDKDGYLWIGTYNGLNCFDGSHFKTWKADQTDKSKLQINSQFDIDEDKHGNIWCANDAGATKYDKSTNKFKTYRLINSATGMMDFSTIYNVIVSKDGNIISHSATALYLYESSLDTFKCYPLNSDTSLKEVSKIREGSFLEDPFANGIWVGTDAGMRYFDLHKKTFIHYKNSQELPFTDHDISVMALDNSNQLVYYDNTDLTMKTFNLKTKIQTIDSALWLKDHWANFLYIDKQNNKWCSAYSKGLFFIDSKSGIAYSIENNIENNYSIASPYVSDILEDDDGTMYFATNNGISFTNPDHNFFSINILPNSLHHERAWYVPMILNSDKQNNIWLAPSYSKAVRFNTATNTYTTFDFFPKDKKYDGETLKITSMQATETDLYFGTTDGIYIYNVSGNSFKRLEAIPESENLRGKYILQMMLNDNELWFTSHHNGIFMYNIDNQEYEHYKNNPADKFSFTPNYVFDIYADKKNNVWISAENEGILRFDRKTKRFIYIVRDECPELNEPIYSGITSDKYNNIWVTNYMTGVTRYNPSTKQITRMSSSFGLSSISYNALASDDENIWLVKQNDLSILNVNTLKASNYEFNYTNRINEFASRMIRMHDGRMLSEAYQAFIIFNPEYRLYKEGIAPVTVSSFTVGGITSPFLPRSKELNLSPSQNFFSLDFSTLSFLKRPDLQFSYMLEGIDQDWVHSGKRQTAYYTNVPGGHYKFRVRVMDENGKWHEASSPLLINVSTPFYSTAIFKIFLLIILILLIYWYYQLYKSKEIKEKTERAIAYFAKSVSGKNKTDEILWDIAHNVIARTDFEDCVIYLLDEKRNVLIQKAAYGTKNPDTYEILNPIEINPGEGIVGTVAITGIPEVIHDTSKDPRYISDDAVRFSEITVPILFEGKVIGVIDCEHPDKKHFNHRHLQLLQTIASISGTKLTNAIKEAEIAENEKRLNDLTMQMAQTRQQALRAQMNPHFIFNCLNSINGFILQNEVSTASRYLIKFSKLIRLILEHSNEKYISLSSELDALKLYIEMEQLRFEKKFSFEIIVDDDIPAEDLMVPPLIYQPFIENSIWHGLLHQKKEGRLTISLNMDNNFLECHIEDNGIGREMSASLKSKTNTHKKSLGLKLTSERLAIMKEQEGRNTAVEVYDLVDPEGIAAGTKVIIKIENPINR